MRQTLLLELSHMDQFQQLLLQDCTSTSQSVRLTVTEEVCRFERTRKAKSLNRPSWLAAGIHVPILFKARFGRLVSMNMKYCTMDWSGPQKHYSIRYSNRQTISSADCYETGEEGISENSNVIVHSQWLFCCTTIPFPKLVHYDDYVEDWLYVDSVNRGLPVNVVYKQHFTKIRINTAAHSKFSTRDNQHCRWSGQLFFPRIIHLSCMKGVFTTIFNSSPAEEKGLLLTDTHEPASSEPQLKISSIGEGCKVDHPTDSNITNLQFQTNPKHWSSQTNAWRWWSDRSPHRLYSSASIAGIWGWTSQLSVSVIQFQTLQEFIPVHTSTGRRERSKLGEL